MPLSEHLAGRHRVDAGDHPSDLGAAAANQTGKPDDLAGTHREGDLLRDRAAQVAGFEDHLCVVGDDGQRWEVDLQPPPEHADDQRVLRLLGDRRRSRHLAVAHDRHGVGDVEHLVEEVTDVDQRAAVGGERTHQRVQAIGLVLRQRRGRLVENDETGVASEGAHDLDLLLVGQSQRGHRHISGKPEPDALLQLSIAVEHRAEENTEACPFDTEKDVLGDRPGRNE